MKRALDIIGTALCVLLAGAAIAIGVWLQALDFGNLYGFADIAVGLLVIFVIFAVERGRRRPAEIDIAVRIPRASYTDRLKAQLGDLLIAANLRPPAAGPEVELLLRIPAPDVETAEGCAVVLVERAGVTVLASRWHVDGAIERFTPAGVAAGRR